MACGAGTRALVWGQGKRASVLCGRDPGSPGDVGVGPWGASDYGTSDGAGVVDVEAELGGGAGKGGSKVSGKVLGNTGSSVEGLDGGPEAGVQGDAVSPPAVFAPPAAAALEDGMPEAVI